MMNVLLFKQYLSQNLPVVGRLYNGNVDNIADDNFIKSVKILEAKLSDAIGNKSINGLIWQNNSINPKTSIKDIKASIALIYKHQIRKSAQPVMDSIEPYEDRQEENPPSAFNFQNTPPGYLETMDPAENQRNSVTVPTVPAGPIDPLNMDERMIELLKLKNL